LETITWTRELADRMISECLEGKIWAELGRKYGRDPSTLRRHVLAKCSPDLADQYRKKPKRAQKSEPIYGWIEGKKFATAEYSGRNTPITLEEMVEIFDIDLDVWEPVDFTANYWDMTSADGEAYRNYQGKAKFKRIAVEFDINQAVGDFIAMAKDHVRKYPAIKRPAAAGGVMLEIDIFDLHLAKYSNPEETGAANNLEIASETFLGLLGGVIDRTKDSKIDRILFPIGNDFFHCDNHNNATTYGTPQDTDGRWQESYSIGQRLLVRAIDRLREIAPVDVVVIPGNHDVARMFYVGEALVLNYLKCPDVTIANGPDPRKYYCFGKVLLGFTHGGRSGPKTGDLHNVMAQERPEEWGKTIFREWHLGHIHITRKIEYMTTDQKTGVVIRHLRSPTPPDAWHHERGFIASGGGIDAFLWDRDRGLTAILKENL
jgi:hypothetical protein